MANIGKPMSLASTAVDTRGRHLAIPELRAVVSSQLQARPHCGFWFSTGSDSGHVMSCGAAGTSAAQRKG